MPDRTRPPRIQRIDSLHLPRPELSRLDNGVEVYAVRSGPQEVIKVEVIFRAGRPVERKPLVARSTIRLLREGTRRQDAAALADTLDYYGSSLSTPFNLDTAQLTLYCLARHVDEVLPELAEMLAEPAFPESELRNYVERSKRKLQVDTRKTDVEAYRQFTACLYGETHPYGYNSSAEAFDELSRDDLLEHYTDHFLSGNCFVVVSGGVDNKVLTSLNRHLGQAIRKGPSTEKAPPPSLTRPARKHISRPDAVQTSIRVGRRLFPRSHPDFEGLNILATALGGYFGSRLMANVREDKGYTYNIYAMVDNLVHDGAFYVATEVGNEAVHQTLREIYREIDKLCTQPLEKGELDMLRNYLMGSYLSALDGPFNQAEVIRNLLIDKLPLSAFEKAVETLQEISPAAIRKLAQKYLQPEEMWEVLVGVFS